MSVHIIEIALLALIVLLVVYVIARQYNLRRRVGRLSNSVGEVAKSLSEMSKSIDDLAEASAVTEKLLRRIASGVKNQPAIARNSAKVAGEQIEALLAAYRMFDGLPTVPTTGGWAASADFVRILMAHISEHQPKTIVECGSGTSTIAMAYVAQGYGGKIFAIENDRGIALKLEDEIKARGLSDTATIIRGDLTDHKYAAFDHSFNWYSVPSGALPKSIDMLVVDGPRGDLNPFARYPAGPELLKLLSPDARIFLDDTNRPEDGALPEMWRSIHPELAFRSLPTEKGTMELYFDHGGPVGSLPVKPSVKA